MSREASAKYYQKNKENKQKMSCERSQNPTEEEKSKKWEYDPKQCKRWKTKTSWVYKKILWNVKK